MNPTPDFKSLKKTELHRHLELSMREETILDLAPSHGFDIETAEQFKHHFIIDAPMTDLGAVLHKFLDTQKLLSSTEILERLAFEACEDAFLLENVRILELRYAPTFVADGHDLNFDQIHQAFVKGIHRAQDKYDIKVGLMGIVQRILGADKAGEVIDFFIDNKDTFIGVDLADNEVGFEAAPFTPYFLKAKEAGLGISIHAGEAAAPGSEENVRVAIAQMGATRIGHGLQIYRNPEIVKLVKDNNVCLEICPKSNWLTQAVESHEAHPLRQLMEAGVKITINSDDPGIFATDLNQEFELIHKYHGITLEEAQVFQDNAREATFVKL